MSEVIIKASELTKEFAAGKKSSGILGAFKNLFVVDKTRKTVVDKVSFEVKKGEIVGYIGPNGAGKSTTIKMMCGILTPTSGSISIYGMSPQKDRQKIVKHLGVVFGQRSQLYWDLRLGESFELLRRIYDIPKNEYNETMEVLSSILSLDDFIDIPVRQLSLGQRMRGDLAASMLHSPEILFLDEPTIGLDVDVKHSIRKFIKDINETRQTTIILTTHDLDDVQALCERIIIINNGVIVSDTPFDELIEKYSPGRRLIVDFYTDNIDFSHPYAKLIETKGSRAIYEFGKNISASDLISAISNEYRIRDLSLEETDIDDIIRTIYENTGT